jgi:hypothetical protein
MLVTVIASDPVETYHHIHHRHGHLRILHLWFISNGFNARCIRIYHHGHLQIRRHRLQSLAH